jgi:hypothetical protein
MTFANSRNLDEKKRRLRNLIIDLEKVKSKIDAASKDKNFFHVVSGVAAVRMRAFQSFRQRNGCYCI